MAKAIKAKREYVVTNKQPKNSLIGKVIGKLVVVQFAGFSAVSRQPYWTCSCQCGQTADCRGDHLISGRIKSCGCMRRERSSRFINLAGKVFDRWTVIEYAGRVTNGTNSVWLCNCSCGTTKVVIGRELTTGGSRSCGCYQREHASQSNTKHGLAKCPEYGVWASMIGRCYRRSDPSYNRYGGRGIEVCDQWRHSFECFINDMGRRPSSMHSIDRIDNDCSYSPGNCRWATPVEQSNNRRSSRYLDINGQLLTIAQWAVRSGVKRTTIWARLERGWEVADAVWRPIR